jgi:Flp pilus assembly protein TadG
VQRSERIFAGTADACRFARSDDKIVMLNWRRFDEAARNHSLKSGVLRSGAAKGRSAKGLLGRSGGWTSAEFAIVSLLFFFLLFAVMDYGWIFFAQMNVQQAVDDGGRYASTGNHSTVTTGGVVTTLSRMQSIIDYIQNEISVPGVNVQNALIVCDISGGGGCSNAGGSAPAGNPGDTVQITMTTTVPLTTLMLAKLFTGGVYTFTASTTFRNEPFPPSETN